MKRTVIGVVFAIVAALVVAGAASAQTFQVGEKVMPKAYFEFTIGEQVIGDRYSLPLTVQEISGELLGVDTWERRAWVKADQFIPLSEARKYYTEQLAVLPNVQHYGLRAIASKELGHLGEALADYDIVLRLDPTRSGAFVDRAWTQHDLAKLRDAPENERLEAAAIDDMAAKIRLAPRDAYGYEMLAWWLATSPVTAVHDGARAVKMATRACELTSYNSASELSTLAAAYARSGDFASAVKWQEKAVTLSDESGRAEYQEMLDAFRANKPWVEQ